MRLRIYTLLSLSTFLMTSATALELRESSNAVSGIKSTSLLKRDASVGPWQSVVPSAQNVDAEKLAFALQFIEQNAGQDGISQTLVIRNSKVIYAGKDVDKIHNVYSVTKSFVSTALGLLIDEGKTTLDTPLCDIDERYCESYQDVTLRHFSTMTSGYNAAGENRWGENSEDWSQTPFKQSAPLFVPGSRYAYWDEAMIVLGQALTIVAKESLYDYLDKRLMQPLGINNWSWWHEMDFVELDKSESKVDMNYGPGGIELSAISLAKYGELFLNKGRWPVSSAGSSTENVAENTQQIVPTSWVEQATQNQVSLQISVADTDRSDINGVGYYGFNWWVNGQNKDGQWQMPDAPKGMYYARGFNNNMLFVVPQWNMVLVRMGMDDEKRIDKVAFYNRFFERLSLAIE